MPRAASAQAVNPDLHVPVVQPIPGYGVLNYDETATALRCTRRHVERLISRGQLRAVALGENGKMPRIRVPDLLSFIDGLEPIDRSRADADADEDD